MFIKKILIANRSEIALRIMATCHSEGLLVTAIYTEEDKLSLHVYKADEAFPLTQTGYKGYMDQDEIIAIAKSCGADAIHPGYGFLSENADFAKKVINSGITWIGPDPEDISLMGDKSLARTTMKKIDVLIITGLELNDSGNESFLKAREFTKETGYPVILKAALGGGGKAMKIIYKAEDFEQGWENVCLENKTFFKSEKLIIEQYIQNGRHVEIQIASDGENVIHLYERECSIQRRQQKVIEEAPCRFVSRPTLQKMYLTATTAVKKLGYKNVGTMEFIVTPQEKFYFLEMNTRLQVEHTVTEAITGIDLVWLQLEIARGKKLPLAQSDIYQRGHALECRILTEDPHNFTPSCGILHNVKLPSGPYIRHEHAIEEGLKISPLFDSMISKLITHASNREAASAHMLNALRDFQLAGVKTNIPLLINILLTKDFTLGQFHTKWLTSTFTSTSSLQKKDKLSDEELAIVSYLLTEEDQPSKAEHKTSRWKGLQWQ